MSKKISNGENVSGAETLLRMATFGNSTIHILCADRVEVLIEEKVIMEGI